jgi:integrase
LGKQKTLAFGVWPDTGLAEAREQRDAARKVLARGEDPSAKVKLDRIAATVAAANSFKAVAEEWIAKCEREGLSSATMKKLRWLLEFTYPSLGSRPITAITTQELLLMLRKMENRGRYETAKRLRSTCSQIFRYAIATARAERDVAADLRGALIAAKPTHRAAITTPNEAGALLRAIEGFDGHATTRAALRLLPHVFVRPGELRFAEWSDIDFDKAVWTIPPHKTKMRRVHSVPLSAQALDILASIETDSGLQQLYLPVAALSEAAHVGKHDQCRAATHGLCSGRDDRPWFSGHGSDLLNEMGLWHADAIERQLAHTDNNAVRRAYTRGEYWDERVRMMQHWSDYLDGLRRQ